MADTSPEDWANIRRWWFGSVYEIADIDYQRRTWLSPPDSSPHWSYVEFCCNYPDGDQLRFARERGHLSSKEFELLSALAKAIFSHKAKNDYDHRAILEDPGWLVVVAKAEMTRQQLLAVATDAIEQSYLAGKMGTA